MVMEIVNEMIYQTARPLFLLNATLVVGQSSPEFNR